MKRAYLAIGHPDERSAIRLLLVDMKLKIVGEAANWSTALRMAPEARPDLVIVDWGLVDHRSGNGLSDLRKACPSTMMIVLISHLDAREQAAISAGADSFISKGETAERVVERLRLAVGSLPA